MIGKSKKISMSEFKKYRRTNIAEMREYELLETLPDYVSISQADLDNGSPKLGDMIARNPKNHKDQWLVAKEYFEANFEEIPENAGEKAVYEMSIDCGRSGYLEGIFVAPKRYVEELTKGHIEVYFGEVLGKHSEVFGTLSDADIKIVSDDENIVSIFEENRISSGHNPFEYTPNGSIEVNGREFDDQFTIGEIFDECFGK